MSKNQPKISLITLTSVLLLATLFTPSTFFPALSAVTESSSYRLIVVPTDYSTISAAIENANDGDKIFVKNGTYNEQPLTIEKTINLVGENPNGTVVIFHSILSMKEVQSPAMTAAHINGLFLPFWSDILNIAAHESTFSNLTIKAEQGGGIVVQGDDTQFIGNYLSCDNIYGSGSRAQMINNTITGSVYMSGSNITVIGNNCVYSVILGGSNITVVRNSVGSEIECFHGCFNIVADNTVGYGVTSSNDYMQGNIKVGSFSIAIGNNVTSPAGGWLRLDGDGSLVAKNFLNGGISVEGSNNTVINNDLGCLDVQGCSNNFWANTVSGYNQTSKICTTYTPASVPYAISFGTSYNNVRYGESMIKTENNTFLKNNFLGNTQVRIWEGAENNSFCYGGQGNHWSNYQGDDANGDGIGDSAYFLDERDRDYNPIVNSSLSDDYPLMAPFEGTVNVQLPTWAQPALPDYAMQSDQTSTETSQYNLLICIAAASVALIIVAIAITFRFFKKNGYKKIAKSSNSLRAPLN